MSHRDVQMERLKIHVVGGGFLLIVTIVIYVMGVQPWLEARIRESDLNKQVQQSRSDLDSHQHTLNRLKTQLSKVREELNASPIQLQPPGRVNEQIARLTALGQKHDLKIEQIRPGEAASYEFYDIVPISLVGQGSYRTFTRFINEIHAEFRDLGMVRFDLSSSSSSSVFGAAFSVDLLWFAQPSPVSSPPEGKKI